MNIHNIYIYNIYEAGHLQCSDQLYTTVAIVYLRILSVDIFLIKTKRRNTFMPPIALICGR